MNVTHRDTDSQRQLWDRYKALLCAVDSVGITLDVSRMHFGPDLYDRSRGSMAQAFEAMAMLEGGALANPDEGRMVGHYWLRAPELAPTPAIRSEIESCLKSVTAFSARVHSGEIKPETAQRFTRVLVVGIGGSALGPQLCSDALGGPGEKMQIAFLDNTDADGFDRVLGTLGDDLARTLTVVVSKSGGTKETRNGMLETQRAYELHGLVFARHAVAITGDGSALDRVAKDAGWIARFPMWDWVGGRTSELSAVGLLPAALQGFDIDAMLDGARAMDVATRVREIEKNPAALLALMWHHAGQGRGLKDMVVLPYKDRLLLLSRYLQQLVMESLGKERDLKGKVVNQGIAVYGNKGSTDQHAYVQQLREGVNNFFATFIEVRSDRSGPSPAVEEQFTSGDYLLGFLLGTRRALYDKNRESMTLSVPDAGPRTLGALIALYERAVGLYASLVGINAYHQPGVEAGKKAAEAVLAIQKQLVATLRAQTEPKTVEELALASGAAAEIETVFKILEHLSSNPDRGITRSAGSTPFDAKYSIA
jgi:glucose-6-phosphate isomerase